MAQNQKIVIIGAGFGGVAMAKSFKNKPIEVLLIDQHNYHNFQPLMYQVATGVRRKAVVDLPNWKFQGSFAWLVAWLVWMFIHIFSLVGFRNKFVALIDWFSNYISCDRPLGLIIRTYKRAENPMETKTK